MKLNLIIFTGFNLKSESKKNLLVMNYIRKTNRMEVDLKEGCHEWLKEIVWQGITWSCLKITMQDDFTVWGLRIVRSREWKGLNIWEKL